MSDLTNATPAAAASAPAAPAAPAAPSEPSPGQAMDTSFFKAALAARSAFGASQAPAASESPAVVPAVVTPPPVVAAPPAPVQAPQSATETPVAFLERLAKTENERDSLKAEIAKLTPKASTAEQVEAALAADPIKFLIDRGVTHEALQDFLITGKKVVDPAVAEATRKADATAQELAEFKRAESARAEAENIAAFKRTQVAPALASAATVYPMLHELHGDKLTELVYDVMNSHYLGGESVSAEQAAAKLEGDLVGIYERLAAKRAPKPAPAAAPAAPKQKPRDLINAPVGSEAEPVPDMDMSARHARALEMMRRRAAE